MISFEEAFGDPRVAEQITHLEEIPNRDAIYGQATAPFHPRLLDRLAELKIEKLYSHQALAYDASQRGEDLIVTTGTNSGKTMCYNLPAMQACLTEPAARCLYIFPTKSLAQDQMGRLEELIPDDLLTVGTYDGDTPKSHRSGIRKMAHFVLTNPDMLHVGILPSHEGWTRFWKSLRLIVIDEMHVYRGVFGSNVGGVIRRVLRLCEWHRSRPQIIGCSATIGNPQELFQKLTSRTGTLIDQDGSPSGKRTFVFWNPPEIGPQQRLSSNLTTSQILSMLVQTNQRTLAFSRARVSAELVLRYTRKQLKEQGDLAPEAVESYRAGYTAKERRQIEKDLFKGKLLGLSATNAMELGVDVGTLDAVILNGYPGTASSFWQQAGRAGRGTRDALAIYVAHDDPLEQFLVREPKILLNRRNETVSLNPENPQILSQQLVCAAYERPIAPSELEVFGATALEVAESLDRSGELQFSRGMFYYPAVDSPALRTSIRGGNSGTVRLLVDGQEIGSMERWRAMTSAFPGAVYLHRGAGFLVEELNLDENIATLVPAELPHYTQAVIRSVIESQPIFRSLSLSVAEAQLLSLRVTDLIEGYRTKSLDGDTVLDYQLLDLPSQTFDTVGIRFDLPELDLEQDTEGQLGALHGLEHALMSVAPLLCGCDRDDLGSAWYSMLPETRRPAVFVFDRTPGGVGLCESLFENMIPWLQASQDLLVSCSCEDGCPGCLLSPKCADGNELLSKPHSVKLINALMP